MKIDRRYKAVCFDMDGTLLDTKVDYQRMSDMIFDEMLKLGVPESIIDRSEGYKFNIDSGVQYLLSKGMEKEIYEVGERVHKYARDIEMEKVGEARPFLHSADLLDRIHAMGLRTGVLTRGCREYAVAAMTQCGVIDLVDGIVARDDYPESEAKPSPVAMEHMAERIGVRPEEILYFGDHVFDYKCARDAGSGFIGVLTGTFGKEDWEELGITDVYGSVSDFYERMD